MAMHILVVDDEIAVRQVMAGAVVEGGHTAEQAATFAQARARLLAGDVDLALCDIKLEDGNGIDLLRECRANGIDTPFVMVTGFASTETAVDALRAGAADYVIKPVHNEELLHRIAQIEALGGLREENRALRRTVNERSPRVYRFASPLMLEVERLVSKVAPTDSTVLITGESGTGKGIVARMIHEQSDRRDKQFLAVNCSAIPEQLLESEFFGHTKGAFTSAAAARKGLFLQAENGTLFLDEIGELPLHMQSKLLNVIEEKEVRPIGSEQVRHVDTRIVAASNRNLRELVSRGAFREDLYFRLSMFHIAIPPLRERHGDIRGYLHFLLANGRNNGHREVVIDPIAEELLLAYPWPGNVRELENVVNRARILAEDDVINATDLPSHVRYAEETMANRASDGTLRSRMRRFEAEVLKCALDEAGGDRKLAAQRLGIAVSSLYRKLEELES
ncbi:MAG TPA: sigma-54 dependent transcriptional regulator [Usitatibacter sp.]|nr:sigma-54 dependent transcriptional regulator [Usitatibacter sp.]